MQTGSDIAKIMVNVLVREFKSLLKTNLERRKIYRCNDTIYQTVSKFETFL